MLAFVTRSALADEVLETARLRYGTTSDRCPDEDSFRQQVAARLGYQPFTPNGKHDVSVSLLADGTRVRGHASVTRLGEEPGVRDLESGLDKCEPLTAALATAVAIAIDPVRAMQGPSPPLSPLVPAPPPRNSPPATDAPLPRTERPSPVGLLGSSAFVASFGLAPSYVAGAELGVGLRLRSFSLTAAGRFETTLGAVFIDSGDRVEATVFSAALLPCGHYRSWIGCGIARFGAFQGRAPDVVNPSLGTSWWGAFGLKGGYIFSVSRSFGLRALLSLEVPLVRTSLVINKTPVWTAPPALVGLELGVTFSFL